VHQTLETDLISDDVHIESAGLIQKLQILVVQPATFRNPKKTRSCNTC
jgi:hypothetical protein